MAVDKSELSQTEINELFGPTPAPDSGVFELALVLGGTASAGAFTAGALDFLVQALDEWAAFRDSPDPARRAEASTHRLVLKVVAGTSGGGVNATILGRALAFRYPAVPTPIDPKASGGTGNPFYEVWVRRLDLMPMLHTGDIKGGGAAALLNGAPLDEGARYVAGFGEQGGGGPRRAARAWVADPLCMILTVTNLAGVPYATDLGDGLTETFVNHADYARFAIRYGAGAYAPRPDEQVLGFGAATASQQGITWSDFSPFALATAAFPVGLPPRLLERPLAHYRYRVVVLPAGPGVVGPPPVVGSDPTGRPWRRLTRRHPRASAAFSPSTAA